MAAWSSFEHVARNPFSQNENEGENQDEAELDLLCDYILDRLEIEQDEQAPEIYTLRFRCAGKVESASLLMSLINSFSDRMDRQAEETEFGSQLANRYLVERLSLPDPEKVSLSSIASKTAFEGALIGAIFSLVTLSSTRVLAGSPPV
jgi:hypothetical protein